jgi:hypothetical protein
VDQHRSSDPALSEKGLQQAQHLAKFLVTHLSNQASRPVRVICSPMRRTLETIRPTLEGLKARNSDHGTQVIVHGYYFESEGCHNKDKPEPGMTPAEITALLQQNKQAHPKDIQFVGFPEPDKGWYCNGTAAETRAESEVRASKFYVWLCEHLDAELNVPQDDVFDAGVAELGEEDECEHDKLGPRKRLRKTYLMIGHGDFMSLVLKRIVSGFGHAVEKQDMNHRSAMVHWNSGITELEYFGQGRWLIMSQNTTPHFSVDEYSELRTGGGLKDGWSYLIPNHEVLLNAEVSVAFSDELDDYVKEQTEALKSLYLSSDASTKFHYDNNLCVEANDVGVRVGRQEDIKHFIVKRGLQVVGVATYSEKTGCVTDVAVRPSAGKEISETLFNAIREHSKKNGRSGSLLVTPRDVALSNMFQDMGFEDVNDESSPDVKSKL